jgi:hypothetical protein
LLPSTVLAITLNLGTSPLSSIIWSGRGPPNIHYLFLYTLNDTKTCNNVPCFSMHFGLSLVSFKLFSPQTAKATKRPSGRASQPLPWSANQA